MDTTRAQQQELDDKLVAPADRLKIGKSNIRLSSTLKSKEPTLQVVLDALKLTIFYNAFKISVDVPEIYMQEFWITVSRHHSSLRFKLNGKSHTVNVDNFRDMLKICTKLPDLVFQVENKNSKKNNDMYYPRFTKVIIDYFMAKDQAIPRRNKMFWHHARDDFMFTTTEDTHATEREKDQSSAKGRIKLAKKKQPAEASMDKGLTMLSDVALTEAEQLKLVIKRIKTQTRSSHANGSGADEGAGDIPRVLDVSTYGSDDEQISWKSSEEDDKDEVNVNEKDNDNNDDDDDADNQDDENPNEENQDDDDDEQTDSDNDGDDFVHPKFSTHDDDAKQDEEVNEEDSFDPRVQTPSHVESTNDESNKESNEVQGTNSGEEEMVEEATHEEDEANELYRDVNINLEGRDIVITNAPLPNVQATQETEDTHVILTALINPEGQQQSSSVSSSFVSNMLNPKPDTCIDSIFILNTEATSLVDVPVTTIVEPPLVFATTLPPPPTPLITHMQQTSFPIPTTTLSTSLQDLSNFGSLFGFDHRIKTLETDFSDFKQTDQFAKSVSSIPSIVDNYPANKMNKAIKTVVQLQSNRLRESSTKEDSLKKILIDKMESNKLIHRSNEQKNLHKALVEAYESDKLILDTYGDTVSFKRHIDDKDKDEEPSVGSNRGSKRRRAGKEPELTSAPKERTTKTIGKSTDGSKSQHKSAGEDKDLEELAHQEFDIGATEEQSDEETSQHPDWFQKPAKPPTSDRDWNKTVPVVH
ncbi:hypothetical protein Tco_1007655, partial [Tanacetum coccineum]